MTTRGLRFDGRNGPMLFESAALARKGDLELRLDEARDRAKARAVDKAHPLRDGKSLERMIALYVDMIAVIDRHTASASPAASARSRGHFPATAEKGKATSNEAQCPTPVPGSPIPPAEGNDL